MMITVCFVNSWLSSRCLNIHHGDRFNFEPNKSVGCDENIVKNDQLSKGLDKM